MRKNACVLGLALMTSQVFGYYWVDPETGIEWRYQVSGGCVTIGGGSEQTTAIQSSTSGDLVIPSVINGYPVKVVNDYAFWRCDKLSSVDIPEGVTHVRASAFVGCANIRHVNLPTSIKVIGDGAFAGTAIATMQLPATIEKIGRAAFGGCANLVKMEIPKSIADFDIPNNAWPNLLMNCISLKEIVIPFVGRCRNNWDGSGANAILGSVVGFESVHLDDPEYKDGCKRVEQYYTTGEVYLWVYMPTNLQSVTVTDDTTIGLGAFSGCSMLKHIVIGDRTETIRDCAFRGCTGLEDVRLGSGVKTIGQKAFAGCNDFDLYFAGDCPTSYGPSAQGSTIFADSSSDGMVYVEYGTKGWDGDRTSIGLPADGLWPSVGTVKRKIAYNPETYHPPVISPNGGVYEGSATEVSIACSDPEALIYYTLDGSEPSAMNGRLYKGTFAIYETVRIRAVSIKDGWLANPTASATFTKVNAIGPAIEVLETLPDNDKTHPWTVVTDVTHDGISAVKSGDIEDEESTTIKVVVYGAGQLSFWWRTSCEPSIDGEYYDYATFYNGSTEVAKLAGVTDWQRVTLDVAGTGKHTFKWTYQKDDSGSMAPDGMWLDQVQWLGATTDYYADHTLTTDTPVPYKWLMGYGFGMATGFETAAKSKTGKRDAFGRELTVEADYVAGTDPTNATSQLRSHIAVTNGVAHVTWEPNHVGEREYKIWGKESLDDAKWQYPTNALHRFFKVTVGLP